MNNDLNLSITSALDYLKRYPSKGTSIRISENLYFYILKDFLLAGEFGLPISSTNEVIRERVINFDIKKLIAEIHSKELSSLFVNKRGGNYLPLYGDWAEGFWHWILENLPYIILAEDSGYDGYYIITPESHARQSMELLGIDPQRILEYHGGHLYVENLYLVQRYYGWELYNYPDILKLLRKKILSLVQNDIDKTSQHRIYISRNKLGVHRRMVVNEDALLNTLKPYGFKTVHMEDLSLKEQLSLMANATALITPHGAGMVHTLFMPVNSLILELFAPTYINPTMLSVMNLLNHNYYMIPSYLNEYPPVYKSGWDIEAFIPVIDLTLRRELGKPS